VLPGRPGSAPVDPTAAPEPDVRGPPGPETPREVTFPCRRGVVTRPEARRGGLEEPGSGASR